jgi:hypothetical protein
LVGRSVAGYDGAMRQARFFLVLAVFLPALFAFPHPASATVVFLTSGTTWTVPSDWNSSANTIEAIGGGGGGSTNVQDGSGGGGGAYAKISNFSSTGGTSITIQIGAGGAPSSDGTDTYFNGASCAAASVCAKAGAQGVAAIQGGAGGDAGSSVGTTVFSGGAGGFLTDTCTSDGGGGGGAGGPHGNGQAGGGENCGFNGGGGGGGAGGGTAGNIPSSGDGAAGGNNYLGSGSGPGGVGANGTAGTAGGGGGGGADGFDGGAGGPGTDWDSSHGAGGGGGGAGGLNTNGADGGLYGGGGGGKGDFGNNSGSGAQGIIVVTYTPAGGGAIGRIIRLRGGVRIIGGVRLGGTSPIPRMTFDPAITAWVSAVVAAGGNVSDTQKGYVNNLITCYRSAGVFNTQDREWLLWSENIQQAQTDIINLDTWTAHGTNGFTADAGYTGDGSTSYLDTNFTPSTVGGNFAQNSAAIDVYDTHQGTGGIPFGENGGVYILLNLTSSGNVSFELNGATFPGASNPGGAVGLWSLFRTDGTTATVYKNGGSFTSGTDNTITLPNQSLFIGAQNDSGTADIFSNDTLAMFGIGGGLTGTQAAAKAQCDNGYATSKGFNVF